MATTVMTTASVVGKKGGGQDPVVIMDGDEVVLQIRDLDAEAEADYPTGSWRLPPIDASPPSSPSSSTSSSSSSSTSPPSDQQEGQASSSEDGGGGSAAAASQGLLLPPPVVSSANVGSLLRFFQSMFFDTWITISYLYKFREHAGVCDYLCNELYKFQERDIEKYIPQLCILLLNKKEKDNSLARFMMDKCASSMHFALQIAWQLQAYITYGGDRLPTSPQEKEFKERCLRLHEEVETATVNCKSSLRLRALVDFSPFVASGSLSKSDTFGSIEDNGRSLDPQLVSKRLIRSLSDRRSPQQDGSNDESATNGKEVLTSSPEESETDKDENNPYHDGKDEDESYKKWDAVLHDQALPQEDAMHIILGLSKRERAQYYSNVVSFVDKLIEIGDQLIHAPEALRKEKLESEIRYLGEHLVDGLYLPICGATDSHHCIVRLLPAESIPLHSKSRVPYLFYYEIIESREKCSAPNLHSFNLEAARLGAGVPDVLSPFDEPELIDETKMKKVKSNGDLPSSETLPQRDSKSRTVSNPTLTPTKRVKEASIVHKMGFYTEHNLASLQQQQQSDEEDQETPDSPFDEMDRHNEGNEVDQHNNESDEEDQRSEENGGPKEDSHRSSSDAAMLQKLYEMGRKSSETEPKQEIPVTETESNQQALPAPAVQQTTQDENQDTSKAVVANGKATQPEITLCSIFGESWKDKEDRIRKESPFSHLPNWKLSAVIVKSGDDLRQEQLASQLLAHLKEIFENAMLPLFLYPYEISENRLRILVTSADSGLIELIPDSISLHQLKKRTNCMTLAQYFKTVYRTQDALDKARINFVESMAGYSLACYFLQVKDRHNGNIMIDSEGHIIHIDYGFFIFNSPGSLNFESAPFKLTAEYMEVMGGPNSTLFAYFKDLIFRGFIEARKYHEKILLILEIWLLNSKYNTSVLPCLAGGKAAVDAMAERFKMGYTEKECRDHIDNLIQSSLSSWRTREYDRYQFLTRGVLYSNV